MRGTVHLLLTAAAVAPVAYAVTRDGPATAGITVGIAFASLLPDLDHPASLAAGLLRVRGGAARWKANHRHRSGWTHSLLACLAWPLLIAVLAGGPAGLPWRWCLALYGVLAAGGLLHVLEDALPWGSRSGVPLFAPLSHRQWKLGRTRRARPVAPLGNRSHAEIDARVLAAFRGHKGALVAEEKIARKLGYSIKTVHNACGRLKGQGLESPEPDQWQATAGAS